MNSPPTNSKQPASGTQFSSRINRFLSLSFARSIVLGILKAVLLSVVKEPVKEGAVLLWNLASELFTDAEDGLS